jgi:hypothetical protein
MMKNFCIFLLGACIAFGSCSTGDAASAAQMLGGSSQALLYLNCRAVSEDEIEFEFSRPVTVKSINFEPAVEIASIQDGSTVRVRLEEKTGPGILFTADLLAEDDKKNTINVLISFRSRNNRMPSLVINELRTENSKPKAEFIELKMMSDGNLGAVRVFIASNNKEPMVYEFQPVNVKKGEYVVLHLRTTEEGCVDELGSDLSASRGTNATATARDFWAPGNLKLLRKTDAVYLLDQDDRALDAVMLSETQDAWWSKDYFAEAAGFLFSQGAWKTTDGRICGPGDAVISAGTTNTRTICRDEKTDNSNTAADWYITATSSATPGSENSEKRF